MNEPSTTQTGGASGDATVEKRAGFLQNLVDVYFAPKDAFTRIVARPSWIVPAVAYLVVSIGFFAVWAQRVDPREFAKAQIEQSRFADKMTAEQRAQAIDQQAHVMIPIGAVSSAVVPALWLLLVAGVLLFVFRFFYAAELGFRQSLAISAWSLFAVTLVTSALGLTVLGLKGDWTINPGEAIQANVTLLLDRGTVAKPLWALAGSLDLFSFWLVFLLASGYGIAARRSTGSAFWGVAVCWAVLVLIKVALSPLF